MKRILINATHNEEIRVALCKDHHLYDFDLENRTREQKKANIYKGHVTRVEPSLEAVFVEYGSARQGFLPLREIAPEYLNGNPRTDNLKSLIKEGDELIIQVEKEERGNKGAAISTYISLAGRYLVLMPNNTKGGGISRQISGKVRDEMRQIIANLDVPKGMSVIVRTAGIGKTYEDLAQDLAHLLDTWAEILQTNRKQPSPFLLYQEAGVVTRAMRDYLKDDIGEIWIDSEHAYNEAASFISQVMPTQMSKLRKYMDFEPMFVRFGIERQIESAYQREVRLPSGGSIVIDQTEAMVAIDINSAKSTKGADVAETAFHTNLEAADEIARQLRLRDMGGLIVIDFIDMAEPKHQKEVEKRLIEATRYDRARVQFAEISKFGLLEMSRQRLRPSLDEATGYICPRCHGNGMVRDLRSLALSIMRQIEQLALKHRSGEVQAEVPTEIAAFLLNEKRESLVYLEQDSGTRITVLPHAHLESPNFSLHFNPDGFAPASYDRIIDTEEQLNIDRGYDVNWQTPEPAATKGANHWQKGTAEPKKQAPAQKQPEAKPTHTPQAVAWLSNLFAPKSQATLAPSLQSNEAAAAIEAIVNTGASSLGAFGTLEIAKPYEKSYDKKDEPKRKKDDSDKRFEKNDKRFEKGEKTDKLSEKFEKSYDKSYDKKDKKDDRRDEKRDDKRDDKGDKYPKREPNSRREPREAVERGAPLTPMVDAADKADKVEKIADKPKKEAKDDVKGLDKPLDKSLEKSAELTKEKPENKPERAEKEPKKAKDGEFAIRIEPNASAKTTTQVVHLSLDGSKPTQKAESPKVESSQIATAEVEQPQALAVEPTDTPVQSADKTKTTETLAIEIARQPEVAVAETIAETITETVTAEVATETTETAEVVEVEITNTEAEVQAETTDEVVKAEIDNTDPAQPSVADNKAEASTPTALPRLTHTSHTVSLPSVAPVSPNLALVASIASQTGRSKNDPRVVLSAYQDKLTGTAGELIHARLADSHTRLAQDGFVACFIEALAQSAGTPTFSNYGYRVLSADEVAQRLTKTAVSAQFATFAGKSIAPALPDTPRAKNDPRGEKVAKNVVEKVAEVVNVTNAEAREPVQNSETAEPAQSSQNNTLLADISVTLESITQTVQELLDKASAISTHPTPSEPKTTVESYKHMIENIAEQLLPQVGILKLATKPAKKAAPKPKKATKVAIKVPKADTKPKTEIRKRKPAADVGNETNNESTNE